MSAEIATLAGGCFWGVEELFRKMPGVISTRVGYTGGTTSNPRYEDVKTGSTGHAEAIEITFDPKGVSYDKILKYFFQLHDPTTENRQGNDRGSQYRSAIFFHNDTQRNLAEKVIRQVDESGAWGKKVVTQLLPAGPFYPAEDFHQKFLENNPGGYTCHWVRPHRF